MAEAPWYQQGVDGAGMFPFYEVHFRSRGVSIDLRAGTANRLFCIKVCANNMKTQKGGFSGEVWEGDDFRVYVFMIPTIYLYPFPLPSSSKACFPATTFIIAMHFHEGAKGR